MTREAKIGMLTGMGVIVLIGVLLSEYLGDRNTGPSAVPQATGKMAALPVGAEYRQQVMTPVGVPAMTPAGGGDRTQLPGGGEVASGIATDGAGNGLPPLGLATDTGGVTTAGLTMNSPVTPMTSGPVPVDGGGPIAANDMATFQLPGNPTVPVRLNDHPAGTANPVVPVPPAPVGTTYVIQSGDTLAKIAKKFYSSSKNSDIARIVSANPGLKDAKAMLVVGKKLTIPNVPAPVAQAPAPAPRPIDPGVVPIPGNGQTQVPIPGVVQPPIRGNNGPITIPNVVNNNNNGHPTPTPAATTSYTVAAGDTLEKIAKKIAPAKVTEMEAKLTSLNNIKDSSKLKVGQVLKVPA